jgi:competence protein ComEC
MKNENKINKIESYFTKSKIFIYILISFIIGIFISIFIDYKLEKIYVLIAMEMLYVLIFVFWRKFLILKIIIAMLFFMILGLVYFQWFQFHVVPNNIAYGREVTFHGIVVEEPDIRQDKIKLVVRVNKLIKDKDIENSANLLNQRILVNVPRYPEYNYGDLLKIKGIVEKPEKINDFDYGKYLSGNLIFTIINKAESISKLESGKGNKISGILFDIKNYYVRVMYKIIPEPYVALLLGLLLGARRSIPDEIVNNFNASGLTHIIAISGYNITIIISAFQKMTKSWSRKLSFALAVIGISSFVIITGASSSVVRAGIMASLFLIATQVGRKGNITIALFLVGFIMILLNPFILRFDIGFQLSFMAVIGLIYVSPILEKVFHKLIPLVKEPLVATLSAQSTTLPILLFYFGRLNIFSPFANILVLPTVPFAMLFGFISGLFGMIIPFVGRVFGFVDWIFLKYIILISGWFSHLPFSSISINLNSWIYVLVYYFLLFIFVRNMYKYKIYSDNKQLH